jgi:hypothetical protein
MPHVGKGSAGTSFVPQATAPRVGRESDCILVA